MNVAIIDYGAGNTRSLQFALERLGVSSVLTADSDVIQHADKVIFPGQGAAQSAMEKLKQKKLDLLLPELTQPVLGICLGMQLLCEQTEEGNVNGLGILSTTVKRFSSQVKVPQMGWNSIQNLASPLFEHLSPGASIPILCLLYPKRLLKAIMMVCIVLPYKKETFLGFSSILKKAVKQDRWCYKTF